jgi:hypothetical protein
VTRGCGWVVVAVAERLHPTCVETTSHGALSRGEQTWVCGQDCPAPIPPDAARDARVAARRAEDARKASVALDRLLAEGTDNPRFNDSLYRAGWVAGYAASEVHHNGHYGVTDASAVHVPHLHAVGALETRSCSRIECHNMGGPCDYCGGAPCRVVLASGAEFCGSRVEHGQHPWSDYGIPKTCNGTSCRLCGGEGVIDQYVIDFAERTRKHETAPCPECQLHGSGGGE